MSNIVFTEIAFEQYRHWLDKDRKAVKKINDLLKRIEREGPLKGLGKPEKLKHKDGEYSRRINEADRLVYETDGDNIIVKSCKGHYED